MARDETVFAAALRIGSAAERAQFLDRACGGDPALRREVESLLQAHEEVGGFLESSPVAGGVTPVTVGLPGFADPPPPGSLAAATVREVGSDAVGPYKLLERLGEGGMGVVYMAEQLRPVRRRVALKIIRPGMDSAQVIARFEAERQALALMDHPNIARVLDAGRTDAGRPYFAMELVRGVPITDLCDREHLTTRERLALFLLVCQAVQHAHTKGVIHRDLKPTNVLVTMHDGVPVPKVIDFGIAKATGGERLTDRTLFTQFAQLVGTPLYMSPEQAEMSGPDVDTRSDVYSLGVLLYELLTGTTPFDRQRLGRAALDEVRRIIREEEPPRPSTRLSTLGEALGAVSARRSTDPRKLGHVVRGELDWIVMRCLEKDRTRRYDTASGLARDVQRYLADEPVEACPPTALYRVGKFFRRHRRPVLVAVVLLASLLAGIVGTTWGLLRSEQNATRARLRLTQIENVNEVLSSIFADLNLDASTRQGKSLRRALGDRLDEVAARLVSESVGDPATVATLQLVLGRTQRSLGYPEQAAPLLISARDTFERLGGPHDPRAVDAANELAVAHVHAHRPGDAIPLFHQAAAAKSASLGPEHPETLVVVGNLADAYVLAGRVAEGLSLLERTQATRRQVSRDPADPHTLALMLNLVRAYTLAGRTEDAVRLGREARQVHTSRLGGEHWQTLISMARLADALEAAGDPAAAVPLYAAVVEVQERELGPSNAETLLSVANLASAHFAAEDYGLAVSLFERALAGQRWELGPDHPQTLRTMTKLGTAYLGASRHDDAVAVLQKAVEVSRSRYLPDHPDTLIAMNNLADAYRCAGRLTDAIELLEETLAAEEEVFGQTDPNTLTCRENLIGTYREAGRHEEARSLLERTARSCESTGDDAAAARYRAEQKQILTKRAEAAH